MIDLILEGAAWLLTYHFALGFGVAWLIALFLGHRIQRGQKVNDLASFHQHAKVYANVHFFDDRSRLIEEEYRELMTALNEWYEKGEEPALHELVDLMYVLYGTAQLAGWDIETAWDRVHAANMAKVQDGIRKNVNGKVMKPEGWEPATMNGLV